MNEHWTDVFFALVGKKATAKSKDPPLADLMGHFHEVADTRMPVIGITAIVTTLFQVILNNIYTLHGQLAAVSFTALLVHLGIYFAVSKPINKIMEQGVRFGRIIANIRLTWFRFGLHFCGLVCKQPMNHIFLIKNAVFTFDLKTNRNGSVRRNVQISKGMA